MPRKGWTKLAGRSERYVSPEGIEVSRRTYDNLRAQEAGFKNRAEFEQRYYGASDDQAARLRARYRGTPREQWAEDKIEDAKKYRWAVQRIQAATGKRRKEIDRIGSPEQQKIQAARRTRWGALDRRPEGPMVDLLIEMDLRDEEDTHDFGDTDNPIR